MFLDFFLLLKSSGLSVTLKEYLMLLEGLNKNVINKSVDEFYYLCRSTMVKHEADLDQFDHLFGSYFQGIESISDEDLMDIPKDWLEQALEREFTESEMEEIKAFGDFEETLERLKEIYEEQKEKHQGGNKWIGTGGTSPFGAYGYNPQGVRMGQDRSRHRRAIKVWDQRTFKNLRSDVELDTRNIKMVLKKLRQITRTGLKDQLDLETTIRKTSANAGLLDLVWKQNKKNNIKLLVLFDVGGSMDDHIALSSRLFSAMRYEFSNLDYFYFHNCVYENLWQDNSRRYDQLTPTQEVINTYGSDYKIIFVGDASMSPYEIFAKYGSVEHLNPEPGVNWIKRIQEHFDSFIWLNPVSEGEWHFTQSIGMIRELFNDKMYPLTIEGLEAGIHTLNGNTVSN